MAKENLPELSNYRESKTTFDKVMNSYLPDNDGGLSVKNEAIKQRWISIWSLISNRDPPMIAIQKHLDIYTDISQAQAYRDLKNANRLFGNLLKSDNESRKYILYQFALEDYNRARDNKDEDAADKAWKRMFLVSDTNKADDIHYNSEKLEDKEDHFTIDKNILPALKQMILTGKVNINGLEAEEINYEEVDEK